MRNPNKAQDLNAEDLDLAVGGAEGGGGIGKGVIMEGMEDPAPLNVQKGEQHRKAIVIDHER